MPWSRHCCSSSAAPGTGVFSWTSTPSMSVSQHSMSARVRMRTAYPRAGRANGDRMSSPDDFERRAASRASGLGSKSWREARVGPRTAPRPDRSHATSSPDRTRAWATSRREQLVRAGARVVHDGPQPEPADGRARRRAAAESGCRGPGRDAAPRHEQPRLGARGGRDDRRPRRALDGLLLNAGIVHPPKERETTADGHEVVFATNVLGHFALAGELLTHARRGIRSHGVARQHVDVDVEVRPGRPAARRGLHRRGARTCSRRSRRPPSASRPTVACARRACRSRASSRTRATRRAGARPGIVGVNEPDEAHPLRRQPAGRDHAVQGARRVDARAGARRPGRRGRRVLGAAAASSAASRVAATASKITRDPEIARAAVGRVRRRDRRALAVRERRRAGEALTRLRR